MKFGDQVILIEREKEYAATVLGARVLDGHHGSDDQPLLTLAFFAPVVDGAGNPVNVLGTARQLELVQFRSDVAHESVTDLGGVIFPGGRWREVGPVVLPPVVAVEGGAMDLPESVIRAIHEDGRAEPQRIALNTAVITTEQNESLANGWTEEAKQNRKWGVKGSGA